MSLTAVEREVFFSRIKQVGRDPLESCWVWTRGKTNGYGEFRRRYTHRISWEFFNGSIPDGLVIDHLCHTRDEGCPGGGDCPHRACVNPWHLEPVTQAVNASRAGGWTDVACTNGHPRSEFEVYRAEGKRFCRECKRVKQRERRRASGVRFMEARVVRDGDV